jgi:hypothetical protein
MRYASRCNDNDLAHKLLYGGFCICLALCTRHWLRETLSPTPPRSARTRKCPHAMRRCVHPADTEGLSGAPPFFKLATAAMLGYNGLFFARACIGVPRVRGLFSCYLGEDALMALLALASCLTNDVVCHTPPHLRTDASAHAPTRLCDCALVPRYWAATYFGCWSPSPSFQTPCTCARCASCVATLSAAPSMCR